MTSLLLILILIGILTLGYAVTGRFDRFVKKTRRDRLMHETGRKNERSAPRAPKKHCLCRRL